MRESAVEIGQALRQHRQQAGLTQSDLARALGKNQGTVSQWESGRHLPGVEDLYDIALLVGVEISDLLPRPAAPREQTPLLLRAFVDSLELESLAPSIEAFLAAAEQLPALDVQVKVSADRPLRAADELLSRASKIDSEITSPPINVEALARLCGVYVETFPFGRGAEEGAPDEGLSGLLVELDQAPVIGIESDQYHPRARFTIAHELGHHLLRHHRRFHLDLATTPSQGLGHGRLYDGRIEREANDFAANVLMPATLVREKFVDQPHARALAAAFEVSPLAMSYRLVDLGLREPQGF